jgi:hypothetical protein
MLVAEEATAHPDKILGLIDAMPPTDAAKLKEFRALLAKPAAKS